MSQTIKKAIAVISIIGLLSCQNNPYDQSTAQNVLTKENLGSIAGAAGGAWIGSNIGSGSGSIAAIAIGTLLGSQLGRSVGQSLSKNDINYYDRVSQTSLENYRNGQTSTWVNPDSGNKGTITPVKTFKNSSGQDCREYTQTITVGGRFEEAYGTACRQPDGTWKIVN